MLTDADRERAQQVAEAAPPLTPEQREQLRLILQGARLLARTDDAA